MEYNSHQTKLEWSVIRDDGTSGPRNLEGYRLGKAALKVMSEGALLAELSTKWKNKIMLLMGCISDTLKYKTKIC